MYDRFAVFLCKRFFLYSNRRYDESTRNERKPKIKKRNSCSKTPQHVTEILKYFVLGKRCIHTSLRSSPGKHGNPFKRDCPANLYNFCNENPLNSHGAHLSYGYNIRTGRIDLIKQLLTSMATVHKYTAHTNLARHNEN